MENESNGKDNHGNCVYVVFFGAEGLGDIRPSEGCVYVCKYVYLRI